MVLFDINVLLYAHRPESPRHLEFREWLESAVSSGGYFSVPALARSGFIRMATNRRIFSNPTSLETAIRFMENLLENPNHVEISPGKSHWKLFLDLCRAAQAKGDLVTDAYFAALALECGGEWITADRDYARFPGLRWRHPLDTSYGSGEKHGPASARESRRRYRPRKHPALKARGGTSVPRYA